MRNAHKTFLAIGVVLISIAAVFAQPGDGYIVTGGVVEFEATSLPDSGYALSGGVAQTNRQTILTEGATTDGYRLTSTIHLRAEPTPKRTCPGDLLDPLGVGVEDLLELLDYWAATDYSAGDLDGDGKVGVGDLLELLANWGLCPE